MASLFRKVTSTVSAVAVAATAVGSTLTASAASEFLAYADALASAGIINTQTMEAGYRLGDNVTRAEMAKIAVKLNGAEMMECAGNVYSDVSSKLGDLCGYVETAADAGIVSKSQAKFRPMDLVTRAEMVKMLMAAKGVEPTDVSAGFSDVTSSLGDLAGYINAAAAEGYIGTANTFRPNATASRGEAFKVAAGVAGVMEGGEDGGDLDLGDLFGDGDTGTATGSTSTGSTSTGSTSTGSTVVEVKAGDLAIALAASSPAAGSIPATATVPFGKFDLSAGGSDVTVRSITLKRDGLGTRTEVKNVWFEMNGVRVSTKAAVSSDETAVVSLSPSLVVKAGSTATLDLIVEVAGTSGSQHRFGIVAATGVDSSASAVKASFPVYTNTLTTANYTVASVSVTSSAVTGSSKVGDTSVVLGDMTLSLGSQNRDVTVAAMTLYNSGTADLSKVATNLAVYNKATGAKVSSSATNNGRYVTFILNDAVAYTAGTRSYQIKADLVSVDRADDTIALSFDGKSEYLTVNEASTGYRATVSYATNANGDLGTKTISAGDVNIVRETSATSSTVAKNTTDVLLLQGTIKVNQPVTIEDITVAFSSNIASGMTRVKLMVGNTSMVADASGSVTFQNTYALASDTVVKVYGDVKHDAAAAVYSANSLNYKKIRYQSNDREVASSAITNAFASSNGITVTVASPTVTVSNNGAAASAQTVQGAKDLVLGKFALVNNNLSDITVSNLAFNVTSTTVSNDFLKNTTVDLYVDGTIKESRKIDQIVSSATGVTFGSTSFTLSKGATTNVELRTTSLPSSYGTGNLRLQYASASMTDSVGAAATVSGAPTGTLFTVLGAGTATFAVSSNNSAKILTASTSAQEIARFTVNATNDDVKLMDLYLSASGLTDASSVISNVTVSDASAEIAKGTIIGGVLKFGSINSGAGYLISKGVTKDLIVKAVVLEATSASSAGSNLEIKLGASDTGAIDTSIYANVADDTARLMSAATSGYLSSSDVSTATASAAKHLVTNSKPVFAAAAGSSNDEHKITVTVDAAGKILLTGLTAAFNTGSLTGTLYLGTTVSESNKIADWSGSAFTFTGAKTVLGNSPVAGVELAAGSTNTLLLKLSGVVSSTNANSIRTLTVSDAAYQDYVGVVNSFTPAVSSVKDYNNVGLQVSSSTTY